MKKASTASKKPPWFWSPKYRADVQDFAAGRTASVLLDRTLYGWAHGKTVAVPIAVELQRLYKLHPGDVVHVEHRRDCIIVHLSKPFQPKTQKGGEPT